MPVTLADLEWRAKRLVSQLDIDRREIERAVERMTKAEVILMDLVDDIERMRKEEGGER